MRERDRGRGNTQYDLSKMNNSQYSQGDVTLEFDPLFFFAYIKNLANWHH